MKVAIIMGSNSDWPILEPAEKTLKEFGVGDSCFGTPYSGCGT